jgi:hypothetical protein
MTQAISRWPLTRDPISGKDKSMWWNNCYWDRFFSEFFVFMLSLSLSRVSACSYIIWGINNRPVRARNSETFLPHRHERQRVKKDQPQDSISCQLNPVDTVTFYLLKNSFNIILAFCVKLQLKCTLDYPGADYSVCGLSVHNALFNLGYLIYKFSSSQFFILF